MDTRSALRTVLSLFTLGTIVTSTPVPKYHGFVGDSCADGRGTCRVISDCPAAIAGLKRGEEPDICSFDHLTPIVCCPEQGKASQMCNKYAEAVYRYEKSFNIPPQLIKIDQCAVKGLPFIAGGQEAIANEFPHMALIGYGNDPKAPRWSCGGSLISKRYILTAAHCIQTRDGQPRWVRLGELNLGNDQERLNRHVDYEVQSTHSHPKYDDAIYYDDIALLRLKKEVIFTASIRPACLYTSPEVREKELIASGWGYTEWATPEISEHLMKVKLPVQTTATCQDAFRTLSNTPRLRQGIREDSMVCAGGSLGKDTCRGDSGGPLQIKMTTPYCMYSIVGITSFGKANCGSTKSPAVYTRVSHYVPWIESVVWANDE